MKKYALLLALVMLFSLLAACGDTNVETSTPPRVNNSSSPSSSAPSEEQAGDAPQAVIDGGEFALPIAEGANFSIWSPAFNISSAGIEDNNMSPAYVELEARTGIHITWFHPPQATASETFSVAMASGTYDDAYNINSTYITKGADYYIDSEIFLDLQPLIPQYAPNYDYVRRLDNATYMTTITDTSRTVGFFQIAKSLQWPFLGPLGRTDWIRDLGLEIPKTYDQLHDVLVAIKDTYNPEIPLSLGNTGTDDWLMAGFGTIYSANVPFFQQDGKAVFGATTDGFKQYVQLMSDWYAEGLIDRDFQSRTSLVSFDTALVLGNSVGIANALYTWPDFIEMLARAGGDNVLEWRGVNIPVVNEGDTRPVVVGGGMLHYNKGMISAISVDCKDVETLMKWFDYGFTEEGSLLANYGLEGEAHTIVDGKPALTDLITQNPENLGINAGIAKYCMDHIFAFWFDWERELGPSTSENVYATREIWDGNWVDEISMPSVTRTEAENATYSAILNDINTFLSENIVAFILGAKPMSEWDSMISTLDSMGLATIVQIQQAALDRYYAR